MLKRLIFFLLLLSVMRQTAAAQTSKGEANLKAVFIYNFTRYIEWDSAANLDKNNFVIGVIGPSPVTSSLSEIARTNRVGNKRIIIHLYNKPEEIRDCHILFIPKDLTFSLASILEHTRAGTLTVSETPGFARQGTALNFVIKTDKLKFEANLKALAFAGLRASSQLLKLAEIID
jgi:hypothetical protein